MTDQLPAKAGEIETNGHEDGHSDDHDVDDDPAGTHEGAGGMFTSCSRLA